MKVLEEFELRKASGNSTQEQNVMYAKKYNFRKKPQTSRENVGNEKNKRIENNTNHSRRNVKCHRCETMGQSLFRVGFTH